MKQILVLFTLALLFSLPALAQPGAVQGVGVEKNQIQDEMSPLQRQAIFDSIAANRLQLEEQGVLPVRKPTDAKHAIGTTSHSFEWPITSTSGDPGYYGISNYVDQDPLFPNKLLDFNCGTRTYDLDSGYNHRGIDMFSWPFPWLKMDNNEVLVIAAEPGIIVGKSDGNFDRSCGFNSDPWNAVYIQHADGSVAWYGHLKKNSVTTKSVGDSVVLGETLGVMGSSGSSTGPHLHFEVYDAEDQLIEPFAGNCNSLNTDSWWNDQESYRVSSITKIATHNAPPVMDNGCGVTETANFDNYFNPGERVYPAVYLRDQLKAQTITLTMLRPDGSSYDTWTIIRYVDYPASWWFQTVYLPETVQTGRWTWRAEFEGQTENHYFYVGDSTQMFEDGFESP